MDNFLTLKAYDRFSTLLLRKSKINVTDHNIAFVNEMMMKADMKYDDDRTGGTRDNFRFLYAIFAIKSLKRNYAISNKKKSKNNYYYLYEDLPKSNTLNPILIEDIFSYREFAKEIESKDAFIKIKNSNIKDIEKNICEKIMFECETLTEVADSIGVTKQTLNNTLRRMALKYPWIKEVLV